MNEPLVPAMIECGIDCWCGQPLNDKYKLKKLYGDRIIFTDVVHCSPNASEEEMDAAVAEFFRTIGEDNRVFVDVNACPPAIRSKVYEAGRKNFDRLVAEGKAVL